LRVLSWAAPTVGALSLRLPQVTSSASVPSTVSVAVVAVLFLGLLGRVGLAARRSPQRAVALTALASGLVLWSAGSAVLNSATQPDAVAFPAPGEWLFLAAYLGFSAYLVLDGSRSSAASSAWLDAVIVVGGTACVALVVLVTPLAGRLGDDDVPLLVALLYPLLDAMLLSLLVGQVVLGQRPFDRGSVTLAGAFVVLAVADASLVAGVGSGSYQYGPVLDLTWCLGFLLLVEAALRPREAADARDPDRDSVAGSSAPVLLAAGVALVTLLLTQTAGARLLLDIPAIITLLAVGLRLVLALRQARRMNDALRLAHTDDLTGMPNRRALNDRLAAECEEDGPLALILLDLDGFKDINDTLGHAAGDAALKAIGRRVMTAFPGRPLAVRLGGDEFAILVSDDDALRLVDHALRLRDAIRQPVRVDGLEVCLDASMGISIRDGDGDGPGVKDLLRQADVAMYQAKRSRVGALLYDAGRDDFSRERLRIAEELRRGIDLGEIVVWYQPKVAAGTGAPHGVEALVRWCHPTEGMLSPGVFMPAARRAGLMPELTRSVLRQVVQDVVAWRQSGWSIQVSVNVAPAELLAPSVMDYLFTMVSAAQLPEGSLVVEVTEDSFLADPARAREVIAAIRREGLEVSIDDYGTGFSSLSYLRDLPLQELKIDRSFVTDLLTNPRNHMIVSMTNGLGKGLGLRTVAEGVESAEVAELLHSLGVDVLQGYHFARPMPVHELLAWMTRHERLSVMKLSR
jgi:diguanylate cyclase (GGDEF)-like protein